MVQSTPKWEGAPHPGGQNCASTLSLGRWGEGAEDRGWLLLRAGGSWRQGLALSYLPEALQSKVESSPSVSPPGSLMEIGPSTFLGFGSKSSCLLKKKHPPQTGPKDKG